MNHQSFTAPSVSPPSIPPRFVCAHIERWIDAELEQSFPASGPPNWELGTARPELPDDTQERNS